MALHLVRHGETDWNTVRRIQGSIDIDLNADGRRQAEQLAASLETERIRFSGLVTSGMSRARSTARILGSRLGLVPAEVLGLHEMDFGRWQGLTWDEVAARHPAEFEAWKRDRRTTKAPGGESYQNVLDRALNALAGLEASAEGDLLVVTHGAVILSLRCWEAGVDFGEMDRFRVGNLERFVLAGPVVGGGAGDGGVRNPVTAVSKTAGPADR